MAWFECGGGNNAGPIENVPMLLFGDGEWQNTDLFDVTISPTGAEDLSIDSDGNLIYGANTTGISVFCKDTTKTFGYLAEFEITGSSYMQTGRCVKGADAKRCQNEGYQRLSFHGDSLSNTSLLYLMGNCIANTTEAIFFSGLNAKIRHIYVWYGENPRYLWFNND